MTKRQSKTTYRLTSRTPSEVTRGYDLTYTDANGDGVKIVDKTEPWTYSLVCVGKMTMSKARKFFKEWETLKWASPNCSDPSEVTISTRRL